MRLACYGLLLGALAFSTAACFGDELADECVSHDSTYCHEGVTYWSNSCGDLEEIAETCQHGCSADHSACLEAPLFCQIVSPAAGLVHDTIRVDIVFTGPITHLWLLDQTGTLGETSVTSGSTTATMNIDTTDLLDGSITLEALVEAEDGRQAQSDPIQLQVDNTAPVASFGSEWARLEVLSGTATISLSIQESNLESLRITSAGQELLETSEALDEFAWDTAGAPDGIHSLKMELTDRVGHSIEVDGPTVVVVNQGQEAAVTYSPGAELTIPENWQNVEHHVRTSTASQPGIKRIISWITWDAAEEWNIEYAVGQGLCPHRGIRYQAIESTSGEILIDLARADLDPGIVTSLPEADQNSYVFPHNNDPRTFGAFFGHVAVVDPAEHVNQSLPIEVHYVFLYAN